MKIEKNFKSSGIPELDSDTLKANISSIRFKNKMTHTEGRREYKSVIDIRSEITAPDRLNGNVLEITLVSAETPTDICISGMNLRGVGLVNGVHENHLSLQATYNNSAFKDLHEFLFNACKNKWNLLSVEAEVLGIGSQREWNAEDGALLLTEISFLAGTINT